ncbi:MAG: Small GTP-binding domain protein, Arf-domain signature [Promethearchaeota archaeon]|nr:MAG: Small GTP-binding domain protein, Arf-domain signature [Candidatus Lokiarchaeota archaeon]
MIINGLEKIIQLKLVYFGPALSGKTTSLKCLFKHFGRVKEVSSIENSVNRTLFFDYGTMFFQNNKWYLKIHIYSTTGQDFYKVTRPITLKALDGLIFVIDSQVSAFKRNMDSWKELARYLDDQLYTIPKILAFNKQDKKTKFSYIKFLEQIGYKDLQNVEYFFTIALNGEGILISFETLLSMIFKDFYSFEHKRPVCANS